MVNNFVSLISPGRNLTKRQKRAKVIEDGGYPKLHNNFSIQRSLINLGLSKDTSYKSNRLEAAPEVLQFKESLKLNNDNEELWDKLGKFEKNKIIDFCQTISSKELLNLQRLLNTENNYKEQAVWHILSLIINGKGDYLKSRIEEFSAIGQQAIKDENSKKQIIAELNKEFGTQVHRVDPLTTEGKVLKNNTNDELSKETLEIVSLLKPEAPVIEKKYSDLLPFHRHLHQVIIKTKNADTATLIIRDKEKDIQHYLFETPLSDESLDCEFDINLRTGKYKITKDNLPENQRYKTNREKIARGFGFLNDTLSGGTNQGFGPGPIISEVTDSGKTTHRRIFETGLEKNEIKALGLITNVSSSLENP